MGARAYRLLTLYDPDPGVLVEVGSERGEGSTRWLDGYAREHGLHFYTADIDPEAHGRAKEIAPKAARLCNGRTLLARIRRPISVAYLDGFDWIPEGLETETFIRVQRDRYHHLGYELDNHDCQREHLTEASHVARKAAGRCVVILDDTFPDGAGWSGKGGLAVPYLQIEGFRVVDYSERDGDSLGHAVLRR